MNTFDYRIMDYDIPYSISVDSNDDKVKIVVNKTVVFNDRCASWMKPRTDIMYFPFFIKGNKIVIEIDDRELKHKYNIYINDYSPIDNKYLYADLIKANKTVDGGFFNYIKRNWKRCILKELLWGCTWYAGFTFLEYMFASPEKHAEHRILTLIAAIILGPITIIIEWLEAKDIVKKFNRRFRPKESFVQTIV